MGTKAWIFDPSQLLPGDIVLERGSGWRSKGIALADRGTYSHALLWLGNTDFIEATGDGVRVISFARVIIRKPNRWRLLRFVSAPEIAAKAADFARNMAHRKYDLRGAVLTKAGGRRRPDPTRLFCSQLVAAAYEQAGVSIVDGLKAQQVTPSALENSARLTSTEFQLLEVDPKSAAPLDRDEGYRATMMQQEMLASQAAFEAVQGEISSLMDPEIPGVPFPPGDLYGLFVVLGYQPGPTGLEDKILAELTRHNYFDLGTGQIVGANLEMRRAVGDVLSGRLLANDREAAVAEIRSMAASFQPTLLRCRQNASVFRGFYAASKHPLWLQLATMYFMRASGIEAIQAIAADAGIEAIAADAGIEAAGG